MTPRQEPLLLGQNQNASESFIIETSEASASPVLVLDLRRNAPDELLSRFLTDLRVRLSLLERIEIVGDVLFAANPVLQVLQFLREAAPHPIPRLLLRTQTVGNPDEVRRQLAGIPGVRIQLDFSGQPDFIE